MAMDDRIAINADVLVELDAFTDVITETYVNNDTTGIITLKDRSGTLITTVTPSYVAGSDGFYRVIIPYTITATLTEDEGYTIFYQSTPGGRFYKKLDVIAAVIEED